MDQEKSSKGSAGRKVYTEEFRRSVVDHLISSGKSVAQVAMEFGIKPWNLRDWKRRYGPTAKPADAGLPQSPEALARENRQLRKELARVTMQRDILKKTAAILSEQ